jgi:hypothetical protein
MAMGIGIIIMDIRIGMGIMNNFRIQGWHSLLPKKIFQIPDSVPIAIGIKIGIHFYPKFSELSLILNLKSCSKNTRH